MWMNHTVAMKDAAYRGGFAESEKVKAQQLACELLLSDYDRNHCCFLADSKRPVAISAATLFGSSFRICS
jgi:hypothetical protein